MVLIRCVHNHFGHSFLFLLFYILCLSAGYYILGPLVRLKEAQLPHKARTPYSPALLRNEISIHKTSQDAAETSSYPQCIMVFNGPLPLLLAGVSQ